MQTTAARSRSETFRGKKKPRARMDYQQFIQETRKLDFIPDEETADAAVKAALGVLASRLDEEHARKFTAKLPEPLTYERLRGHQQDTPDYTVEHAAAT